MVKYPSPSDLHGPYTRKKRKITSLFWMPPDPAEEEKIVISLKKIYKQRFDFPYEVMKRILANASYNVVKKLYFTCKYFPSKFRLYLIDSLLSDNLLLLNDKEKRITASSSDDNAIFKERIWIGERMCTSEPNISDWISRMSKCSIRKLEIAFKDLSLNDFKILTKDGTIEDLNIRKIIDENGNQLAVEDICGYVPNAYSIYIALTHVTPQSASKLCKINKTKIKKFSMNELDGSLNVADYLELLKNYSNPVASYFFVSFSSTIPAIEARSFCTTVKTEISKWPTPKPYFSFVFNSTA